jgi:hypothetical protein
MSGWLLSLGADRLAAAVDDVEDAGRQTGRVQRLDHDPLVCNALISLGLITQVDPLAIAIASLPQMKPALLFHGVISPTTPSGSIVTRRCRSSA